jgi:hypothetical protein
MKKAILGAVLVAGLSVSGFGQVLPRPAGPWSAETLDKKVLSLNQYKGKFVVLAFLLTT